jgi:CRISPR-associated protein Csb2
MLALEVEYLLGRSFAGSFRDRAQSEWPPHPGRLFSALAAAYFENGQNAVERAALQWIEEQGAPAIRAGEAGEAVAPEAFVPTNYPGDNVPVFRGKQPRRFPAQGPSEAMVHFIWNSDPPPEIAEAVDRLASRTAYLGKACSLVRMRVVGEAPAPNYVPDSTGAAVLRVPSRGRLNELEWLFQADQQPSAGAQQRYRQQDGTAVDREPASGDFGAMYMYRKSGGPGLPIEATLTLTEAVRAALLCNAGKFGAIPGVLNGHEGTPHCAIVALPFVGSEYGDGHLMGFAVVAPRMADLSEKRVVLGACTMLAENGVNIPGFGDWKIEAADAAAPQATLRSGTWSRAARVWRSVTPILLDRFPKKKGPTVEEIVGLACERAGLPAPASVDHSPYAQVEGASPVPSFRLHRSGESRARWGVHATIAFSQPVRGPVLLGAGRFFGLGLMRPEVNDEHS